MSSPKFQLLYRRVAIKEIKEELKSAGGIILHQEKKPEVAKGEVVAVGDGYNDQTGKTTPMALRVGQKVMYRPGYANIYTYLGEEYVFTNEADVMAVIE
jgi:chaperonin GroES